MALSTHAVLLVLASVASSVAADASKIVRQGQEAHMSIEVDAEGEPREFRSHDGEKRIAMSVNAAGVAEPTELLEGESKAHSLLRQVESYVRSGENPEPKTIRTIKDIVKETLLKDLQETRDSEEVQVKTNLKVVEKCNTVAGTSKVSIDTRATEVDERRKEHATCRESEKTKSGNSISTCKKLDAILAPLHVPATLPSWKQDSMPHREARVDFISEMSQYFCPMDEETKDLLAKCKNASALHQTTSRQCTQFQNRFEMQFCIWRTETMDMCGDLENCYETSVTTYNDHVADVKGLIKKWKTEYEALKKILCYVDVWLSDNNTATADSNRLEECKDLIVNTDSMDIHFDSPAEKAECSLEDVENYPGTESFKTVEYSNFADYVDEVNPCQGADDQPAHAPPPPNQGYGTPTTETTTPEPKCDESESFSGNGAEYRGCQDHTDRGKACKEWKGEWIDEDKYPGAGTIGNNYCRNPGGKERTIWCWTGFGGWGWCKPKEQATSLIATKHGRHELLAKKTSELRKLAKSSGASDVELEDGDDADDSKEAFIALILHKASKSVGSKKGAHQHSGHSKHHH